MSLEKNQLHEVEIVGYNSDGLGVCRLDGQVIFVERGVRGDLCQIRIVKVLKNCAYGRVEELLKPSPHRVQPQCPAFPQCGGCDFWHMSYEEELFYKKDRVEQALSRLAGIQLPELPMVGGEELAYRNKAMFPCAKEGETMVAGFYRRRSHEVVPCPRCLIQPEAADALKQAVLDWANAYRVPCYDETTGKGLLRHIYVRTSPRGALLTLVVTRWDVPRTQDLAERCQAACPQLVGIVLNRNGKATNRVQGDQYRPLWGQDHLADSLCGVEFSLSPASFYQVNREQAQHLYQAAVEMAQFQKEDVLLDLYCGTGTITLVMAPHCGKAVGVEIAEQAVEDAKNNAKRNGVENATFLCADAGEAATQLRQQGMMPTVIVVDPPRKGLEEEARQAVLDLAPRRLIYVSCDPATMARDVKELCQGGYRLTQAKCFDLFPRTANVETLVALERV